MVVGGVAGSRAAPVEDKDDVGEIALAKEAPDEGPDEGVSEGTMISCISSGSCDDSVQVSEGAVDDSDGSLSDHGDFSANGKGGTRLVRLRVEGVVASADVAEGGERWA